MKFNLWQDCDKVPLTELLSFVVDNRGKTVPTVPSGHKLIATNCVTNNTLFPVYEKIRYLSEETYQTWFRAHPIPGDILFVNKGRSGKTEQISCALQRGKKKSVKRNGKEYRRQMKYDFKCN